MLTVMCVEKKAQSTFCFAFIITGAKLECTDAPGMLNSKSDFILFLFTAWLAMDVYNYVSQT